MLGLRTKMSIEEIRSLEAAVENKLIEIALAKKVAGSAGDLVVRDFLPLTDFKLTNEEWKEAVSAYGYATVVSNIKLDDDQVCAFIGVKNKAANPLSLLARFRLGAGGAKIKDIWNLESTHTMEEVEGYAASPVIYQPSETMMVDLYGKVAGTDYVVFLGKMCEPRGKTVVGGA